MTDLANCPFCGSGELIKSNTDCGDNVLEFAHIIACGNCGTRGPWGKTKQEATELWNRRGLATDAQENVNG